MRDTSPLPCLVPPRRHCLAKNDYPCIHQLSRYRVIEYKSKGICSRIYARMHLNREAGQKYAMVRSICFKSLLEDLDLLHDRALASTTGSTPHLYTLLVIEDLQNVLLKALIYTLKLLK